MGAPTGGCARWLRSPACRLRSRPRLRLARSSEEAMTPRCWLVAGPARPGLSRVCQRWSRGAVRFFWRNGQVGEIVIACAPPPRARSVRRRTPARPRNDPRAITSATRAGGIWYVMSNVGLTDLCLYMMIIGSWEKLRTGTRHNILFPRPSVLPPGSCLFTRKRHLSPGSNGADGTKKVHRQCGYCHYV
jgi:hypothetical protein